jgi:hypothetical protein
MAAEALVRIGGDVPGRDEVFTDFDCLICPRVSHGRFMKSPR